MSFGGLCSTYCAFVHPEAIGNVISLSGSYWLGKNWEAEGNLSLTYAPHEGIMIGELRASKHLPIRFFLEVGRFETGTYQHRELRDILLLKGYDLAYEELDGNHQYYHWQGALCDGLIRLLGRAAA